ncbi:MAG: GNAT family N-acetyltransferase [Hyphomicrobium sp.]
MKIRKPIKVRRARAADAGDIRALQEAAFRIASSKDYETRSVLGFLRHAGTLDETTLDDGTCFVVEIDGEIVASGAWSHQAPSYLDKAQAASTVAAGAAVIHGVYCDPAHAGSGLAGRILAALEDDLAAAGHTNAGIATSYTAMPFFSAAGYRPERLISLAFPDGSTFGGVLMSRSITAPLALAA